MHCPVCSNESKLVCSGCRNVAYCSQQHQKSHWKKHKQHCRIYVIKKDDRYGRYVVASRDIAPGTIIMDQFPIMVGPKQESLPICLGCHKNINATPSEIYYCSNCKTFPLCGPSCENMPIHAENECKIYSEHKVPFKIKSIDEKHCAYESIMTLRLLMLKEHDHKKWIQLIAMQPQNENRQQSVEVWHRNQVNTVDLLRSHFGMKEEFSDLDIHSAIGYADINSFEIKSKSIEICGLYDNAYLMIHDCIPNTHHTIGNDFKMIVRASVPIKKGELISTIYAHTLIGTLERRRNLRESKFFDCNCKRCCDPTELGTYVSATKCPNCESGYHLPVNSLQPESIWQCSHCAFTLFASDITNKLILLRTETEDLTKKLQLNGDLIPVIEEFISKHSEKILHPNHYLLINFIHSLSQFYGRVKGWYIDDLSMEILMKKKHHCEHLLKITDVLDPGMSRLRGLTFYELHAAIFFIAKLEFENKRIDAVELKKKLEKVISLLEESQRILNFDPPGSTEWVIATSIPEAIEGVNLVMNNFCQ